MAKQRTQSGPEEATPGLDLQAKIEAAQSGSYLPKEKERHLYHVKLDKPAYNPKTGEKLSKEFIQKFTEAEWNQFKRNSAGLGYEMEIMWNPETFKIS